MPVTRDMTIGERTLLYNFLDAPVPHDRLQTAVPPGLAHLPL